MKTLRLILGDQLHAGHSWFQQTPDPSILYVMMECRSETNTTPQHHQKIVAFFLAMRLFADHLRTLGHHVIYLKITDPSNQHDFLKNLHHLAQLHQAQQIQYLHPDNLPLAQKFLTFASTSPIPITPADSEHFYVKTHQLPSWQSRSKLMESFYRTMRQQTGILMENGKPRGGQWNFDTENRSTWKGQPTIPPAITFTNDASTVIADLTAANIPSFGKPSDPNCPLPLTAKQAEISLDYFIQHLLPHFGKFQDAMHLDERLLFHSNLSFALNAKLITPQLIIQRAEQAHLNNPTHYPLSSTEGFIRQILGWREFMRVIYFNRYNDLKSANVFQHHSPLPNAYWTGKTHMRCLAAATQNSLDHAYAHHIQRLMVLGNFALLMETDPQQLDDWFLGVYADALEWVQLPNTRGMSQFADGGHFVTKPYVSSANYLDKMSNSCRNCSFDRKSKTSPNSCPFNSLYWNFLAKNAHTLRPNFRMKMMYALWDRTPNHEQTAILERAQSLLETRNF